MNVLILCSGTDRLFGEAGYQYPKNLIEINNKPLIQHVLNTFHNVLMNGKKVILTIKKEESERFHTSTVANLIAPGCIVLNMPQETKGAVCTALLAVEHIDNQEPLLVINGDIILREPIEPIISYFDNKNADGGVVVFESVHPRWSYVKCDVKGYIIEATEKIPISKLATVGIYYYRQGSEFVTSAQSMIKKDAQIGGKFYVCPVFNEMILKQKKIVAYHVDGSSYYSLSSPEGVKAYQKFLRGGK